MARDNGGPAFPRPAFYPDDPAEHMGPRERQGWAHGDQEGMTLRDWFAGQALMGFLANKSRATTFEPADDAEYCYRIADAMLEARKQ